MSALIVQLPRKVAATATASAALAKGRHTPVDATSGNKVMTLPTGGPEGVVISVEKIDTSANTVTVTGNIRGVPAQSFVLDSKGAAAVYISDAAGAWWPSGGGGLAATAVAGIAADLDDAAALGQAFGSILGEPISPWQPSSTISAELWTTANMQSGAGYNNTDLTPSITGNGTGQTVRTRVGIGNLANADTTFRIEFDFDMSTMTPGGWAAIGIQLTDSGGTLLSGTAMQRVVTLQSPRKSGHFIMDFKAPAGGTSYLEVNMRAENNVLAGTMDLTNVSVKATGEVSRPMLVTKEYSGGGDWPYVYWQQRDQRTDNWKMSRISFQGDGNLAFAFRDIAGFYNDSPFRYDGPDPAFVRADAGVSFAANSQEEETPLVVAGLRSNNNDQIMSVWNGSAFELRGNTHNGEFVRAAGVTWKVDRGAGFVPYTPINGLEAIRRFQVNLPTEFRRSVDGTTPYANVDHLFTVYPDGVVRCDRTTTFLSTQLLEDHFEWMSSHDIARPMLGRIGRGTEPTGEIDTHAKLTTPVATTTSTATSGGTLPAGTHYYRVAALSAQGETLASNTLSQVTTGAASTVTVNWTAVSGAIGYAIYGRVSGNERLLTRVGAVTTWIDTGSIIPDTRTAPQVVSSARTGSTTMDNETSNEAAWAVFYDPQSGWCMGNIYDRESVLARPQVAAARTRIQNGAGIAKNYINTYWTGGVGSISVVAGTVWSATHYSMTYLPRDPDDYHREIALRASNLGALGDLYPVV
jgi:hypothetical protein